MTQSPPGSLRADPQQLEYDTFGLVTLSSSVAVRAVASIDYRTARGRRL
jgi:hypothetical protein